MNRTIGTAMVCAALMASFATSVSFAETVHPDQWPHGHSGEPRDAAIEAEVARLVAQMTVEEKVGQIIQADITTATPEDAKRYHLGSILNGGGSGPNGNDRAPPPEWLKMADAFYAASIDVAPGRPIIPVIWGTDAVHGNTNIIGATIFPHNIGLGAMRDPELVRKIGEVTAIETRVAGADWSFGPCLAVVRDDRWGRTYESYSEDPRVVSSYAGAIVEGLQGRAGAPDFLRGPHVIASAKHFLGDGGTDGGHDQGDNLSSETELRDVHGAGYPPAIAAGVQTVMASYSSWHGAKMHGNRALLSDVLVDRLGFDGFVVGDWNGHGQVGGCAADNCAPSFNAGLDMFMAPDKWRGLYDNTLAQVKAGTITMARLDQAVARILRVKLRAGVLQAGKPSSRPLGGHWDQLGSAEHRAIARQAVRESLVLLKNDNDLLPLRANANVLVAGDGANNLPKQAGGWTISWQGDGNTRTDFPHAQTIYEGINEHVRAAGGTATLSVDGHYTHKPDVAIVVFGENPYAEFQGDIATLDYQPGDARDLKLLKQLHDAGIPVVAVFLSGRPLYVTPEINVSDAFVAAWLPGGEGGGIADVLFRNADGKVANDFRGKLSFSWPRSPMQTPLNVGDAHYDPLFAFGYGLTYAAPRTVGKLAEAPEAEASAASMDRYVDGGKPSPSWSLYLNGPNGRQAVHSGTTTAPGGGISTVAHQVNGHDALTAAWTGAASLAITGSPVDLGRHANGDMALSIDMTVDEAPAGHATLTMGCGTGCGGVVDVTRLLAIAHKDHATSVAVRLSCFRAAGADMAKIAMPFELRSDGHLTVTITSIKIAPGVGAPTCPPTAH